MWKQLIHFKNTSKNSIFYSTIQGVSATYLQVETEFEARVLRGSCTGDMLMENLPFLISKFLENYAIRITNQINNLFFCTFARSGRRLLAMHCNKLFRNKVQNSWIHKVHNHVFICFFLSHLTNYQAENHLALLIKHFLGKFEARLFFRH